jgi:hypothetical protein
VRRAIPAIALLMWAATAFGAGAPPALPQTDDERQAYAVTICSEMSARAQEHGLPEAFMARLIWKESLFDPGAVSPKGAAGIAQFMPATARRRGLSDPFDPKLALAASAAYLASLRKDFGNLGLAAAAYNAGEDRVRQWLGDRSGLPYETQNYVLSITGHSHDEWKAEGASKGNFDSQCQALVRRELSPQEALVQQANWKPWGAVLSAGFSEQRAVLAFRNIRNRYPNLLKDVQPLITRKRNLSMGRRRMIRVAVGHDSRAKAQAFCRQLTELGGACVVQRN